MKLKYGDTSAASKHITFQIDTGASKDILSRLPNENQWGLWNEICRTYQNPYFEPLMTEVMRFLGIEHTCKRISLLTAVSLVYQAIPVVPTVFDCN